MDKYLIKKDTKDTYKLCIPSIEQQTIIDTVISGENVIVDSVAGSGKTTTILHIGQVSKDKKILVLTYNAKLKIETREKAISLGLTNMEIHSYHAFGVKYYDHKCHTDPGIIAILKGDKVPKTPFRYDLILLDEQQDMTNLYYELVKKIIRDMYPKNKDEIQLACFGDVYQNIYSFKGSDDRYLSFADKLYNNPTSGTTRTWRHLRISESFRITKPMCDFVNKHLLGNNRIISNKSSNSKVRYIICDTFTNTPYDEFRRYIESGYKADDIFILAPSIKKGKHDSPIRILENRIVNSGLSCYVPVSDEEKIDEQVIQNKVVFSTFHQVKGLERKVVLVFNFDESYFDYYGRDLSKTHCPNIIYVALTRAKECMTLFHHYENQYLSCLLDKYRLGSTCNLVERRECLGIKKTLEAPLELSVTELIKNMGIEIIDYAINCIDYKVIQPPEKSVDIPLKIQTGHNTYENVSEINGVAIPAIYEYISHKKVTIIDALRQLITRLSITHRQNYIRITNKDKMTVGDILYLANLYNSITSGYIFKTEQIKEYKWLESKPLKVCLERLEIVVSREGTDYEVSVEAEEIIYNRRLVGILDILEIPIGANAANKAKIWELKCVSHITNEHILQLCIYSWILENMDKYKGLEKSYKLFNIYTNEIIEIEYNHKVRGVVEYLVKAKYGSLARCSDQEFIQKCSNAAYITNTKDKVIAQKCLIDSDSD
jgi:hypothetical protein